MNFRLPCWFVLPLVFAILGRAQTPGPLTPSQAVEELYRGELSDVGPQFLLVPAEAKLSRYLGWTKVDFTATDNANFTEENPRSTNIVSWQGGIDRRLHTGSFAGGNLAIDAGVRAQIYRYGLLGDEDKVIDYIQVDRNNFDLAGPHLRALWQRGPWLADGGVQGAWLHNRSSGRTFYREVAALAALYRQWKTASGSIFLVGGEINQRWSWTDTYGLLPSSWNDRTEGSVSGQWIKRVGRALVWRTNLRVHAADYSRAERQRRDVTGTLGTELNWAINDRLDVRLFISHEERDSTESGIPDYSRWEIGSGGGLHWAF